jgi:hypothetical protein
LLGATDHCLAIVNAGGLNPPFQKLGDSFPRAATDVNDAVANTHLQQVIRALSHGNRAREALDVFQKRDQPHSVAGTINAAKL